MPSSVRLTGKRLVEVPLTTEAVMRKLGDTAIKRIVQRTLAGQAPGGQAFQPYSEQYGKAKAEAVGHRRVDLTLSGEMLRGLVIKRVDRRSVTIGWIS